MTRKEMAELMDRLFEECQFLRGAGQKEYAHAEDNAFSNFERLAAGLKCPCEHCGEATALSREVILMVYLTKHLDGIKAWVAGHKSQREPVRGRLKDAIVYLMLLAGMDEESREKTVNQVKESILSPATDPVLIPQEPEGDPPHLVNADGAPHVISGDRKVDSLLSMKRPPAGPEDESKKFCCFCMKDSSEAEGGVAKRDLPGCKSLMWTCGDCWTKAWDKEKQMEAQSD